MVVVVVTVMVIPTGDSLWSLLWPRSSHRALLLSLGRVLASAAEGAICCTSYQAREVSGTGWLWLALVPFSETAHCSGSWYL